MRSAAKGAGRRRHRALARDAVSPQADMQDECIGTLACWRSAGTPPHHLDSCTSERNVVAGVLADELQAYLWTNGPHVSGQQER